MLEPSQLHVFTARSNPLHWTATHLNWLRFARGMLDAGVTLTVIECAFGEEDHRCAMDGVRHIPVRAKTRVWNKESLINIGVHRTPEARYLAWIDADVIFRRPDWAMATLHALQHYDVVQPWSDAYDLGPNDEHIAHHRSFCAQWFHRHPVIPKGAHFWSHDGGSYAYPHCLPGDSRVVPGGRIVSASSRPFEGDLVVIRTANGQELSCSPDHPVFSGSGWVRADQLNLGDDVMRHVRGNGVPGKPDEKHAPARIEDMVRSFSERAGTHRRATLLPDNLDNNRANSKVAEVWTNRDLTPERDASRFEKFRDLVLGDGIEMDSAGFDRLRAHDFLREAFGLPLAADQSPGASRGTPFLGRRLLEHSGADRVTDLPAARGVHRFPGQLPANGRRFAAGAGDGVDMANAGVEPRGDDFPRMAFVHADDPGGLRSALAGQIERDEIVYVGRRKFSGHLHDLETEYGYIIADGLLTHNSGYAWAMTRQAYDWLGGLFELGGMGSGDHHMALGLAGAADASMPGGTGDVYRAAVKQWEARALRHVNYNIGYVAGTLEHLFHGRKSDRGYRSRWDMFVRHQFDPLEDLKRNSHGVLEFASNKPELRHDFDLYLQSRNEDINSL